VFHDVPQQSEALCTLRCGRLTASRAYDMLPRLRTRDTTARRDYLWQLVQEQVTGRPHEPRLVVTPAMRRGSEQEAAAREAYAARTGAVVHTSGFLAHPTLMAGASLDGHIGNLEGLVEIKAPATARHLWYGLSQRVPRAYRAQITHQLWLTGAAWCDFVSWDDRVWPARQRLHIVRVARDERHIAWYDRCARTFLAEVAGAVQTTAFFKTADLALAREVLAHCTRTLQARGGVTTPRRAA
jgi:hypothetical protein